MSTSSSRENFCKKKKSLLCNIKMIGSIYVNLSRRWGERKDVWEGWKQYMYHKSSPLFHTKMPKSKPILQLLKFSFISDTQIIPLIVDCYISSINFFQKNGIFVFITQCPMFFSQLWLDLLFCVYVHGLTPMKKTSSFFVNHRLIWISAIINNSNYILIGLNTMGHESFEVWIGNISIGHGLV
jgi:hypothetical protein